MDKCKHCGGRTEQGFIPDQTHNLGSRLVSHWAAGKPNKSFWTGVKDSPRTYPIAVFRCADCGHLEAYAREEFAPE